MYCNDTMILDINCPVPLPDDAVIQCTEEPVLQLPILLNVYVNGMIHRYLNTPQCTADPYNNSVQRYNQYLTIYDPAVPYNHSVQRYNQHLNIYDPVVP